MVRIVGRIFLEAKRERLEGDLEDSMRVSKEVCKVVELERSKSELRDCSEIGWFEKGASVPPPIVLFKRKRRRRWLEAKIGRAHV